jgi:hypothetical protein
MAHDVVRSADGTPIAYETFGQGPALVAVCGATCDRALMRPTAQALGEHFTTLNYDRRGRGDSGDTLPYAIEREIEDLAALIDRAGRLGAPVRALQRCRPGPACRHGRTAGGQVRPARPAVLTG